jgi:hypothetical protein
MAEYILVKTPLTTDGTAPLIGKDGKMVYSESVLRDQGGPTGARAVLEKRNLALPQHLKVLIEDHDGNGAITGPIEVPKAPAKQKENAKA